ncbi:MAG: nitrous oxide reductase accessory protein NosL [Minwuia sp.]|nr:nitrous oxide reductase accessory protein NosL [Minwuia sp.]
MRALLIIASLLVLAACQEEQAEMPGPVPLTADALSHFCQMQVIEHGGPKAQIHLEGHAHPIFFAQVRDGLAYLMGPERTAPVVAVYVSDMGAAPSWAEPGASNWINADQALFVVGADVRGGMALTFNGIAQGYVADRVSNLLRAHGFSNVLIDMGEISARGHRAADVPWQVGMGRPDGATVGTVELSDRALATSAPALSAPALAAPVLAAPVPAAAPANGIQPNHIIDPRPGEPGGQWELVSVSDRRAAVADALSTAFSLMRHEDIKAALARFQGARLEHLS